MAIHFEMIDVVTELYDRTDIILMRLYVTVRNN